MAASPTAWLQEWPHRGAGSRAEGGEVPYMLQTKKSLSKNERNSEKWGFRKSLVGREFVNDAVTRVEMACVPRTGVGFKSVP